VFDLQVQFAELVNGRSFSTIAKEKTLGEPLGSIRSITSNVPFIAIIERRNSLTDSQLGWWRVVLTPILYGLFLHLYKTLFGVCRCRRDP
jgi:hypothetical protein